MRRTVVIATLILSLAGCAHHRHPRDSDDEKRRGESEQEQKERLQGRREISQKRAVANAKFQKALAVARQIKPGELLSDFYRQVDDARLALEKVETLSDGQRERYSFMDNNTAFLVVLIKGDRVAQVSMEGVDSGASRP